MKNTIVSSDPAAALIHSGDTICTSGFVGIGVPAAPLKALEDRYLADSEPRNLKLGDVLTRRVAPHIFESQAEAESFLDSSAAKA